MVAVARRPLPSNAAQPDERDTSIYQGRAVIAQWGR